MSRTSINKDLNSMLLCAAIAAAAASLLFYNIMPLYLGALQDSADFSHSQIGMVASAFFFGFNLISASSYFWVRSVPVRFVAVVSLLIAALGLLISAFIENYLLILLQTFFIGGASGSLASIAATIISDTRKSTFWYGLKVAMEAATGVVLLFVLPATLIPAFGFKGVIYGMLIFMLVLAPWFIFLSVGRLGIDVSDAAVAGDKNSKIISSRPVWLALIASLVMCIGGSAIWAFSERIATQYGFDPEWVGMVLGLSLIFAIIGSIISGVIGQKVGNRGPYIIGASLMGAGVYAIALSNEASIYYALGACLFMLGWGSALTHLYAKVAVSDPNGRHVVLIIPSVGLGSMIGPALAGALYSAGSLYSLQIMSVAAIIISIILVWLSGEDLPFVDSNEPIESGMQELSEQKRGISTN